MVAPTVLDGPVTGASSAAYAERSLVPELQPGDIVVMDNLPAHKGAAVAVAVAEAIGRAGCRLAYPPPYSPDLNPIEPMWPKVKSVVRKAAARTFDVLVEAVGDAAERHAGGLRGLLRTLRV